MKFSAKNHKYISDQNEEFISATKFIKIFCEEFDAKATAEKYAKKNGETPEYWINEWKKAGIEASEKGTKYHLKKQMEGSDEPLYNYMEDSEGCKRGINLNDLPEGEHREIIIFLNSAKIAGQSDKVIIKGNDLYIEDYKTNKEIKRTSYKDWRKGHKMMKPPVSHLQDCNFNHYSLQLSLYAYMIQRHNPHLRVKGLTLLHVKDVDLDIIERIPVKYMKEEVEMMIKYYNVIYKNERTK